MSTFFTEEQHRDLIRNPANRIHSVSARHEKEKRFKKETLKIERPNEDHPTRTLLHSLIPPDHRR